MARTRQQRLRVNSDCASQERSLWKRRVERNHFLMMFYRLGRLLLVPVCASTLGTAILFAQQPTPPPSQPQQQPQQSKPEEKKANPFETVPQSQEPAPGQQPQLQAPPQAAQPAAPASSDIIEEIQFRGSRRVPQDTLRALVHSRVGDKLDEEMIQRDFASLWNSGRFDDLKVQKIRGE
jgi:outer membrane protein insertion porin family